MIDPRELDAVTWSDFASVAISTFGPVPKISTADEWQQWALNVIQLPGIGAYAPPDPREFPNWLEWAMRFVQAVPV